MKKGVSSDSNSKNWSILTKWQRKRSLGEPSPGKRLAFPSVSHAYGIHVFGFQGLWFWILYLVNFWFFRIVIGSIVGFVILFALLLYVLRLWMRGPTKGSDNKKKLDGKTVAITGNIHFLFQIQVKTRLTLLAFFITKNALTLAWGYFQSYRL